MPQDYEIYDLGDVRLQRGATLRDCKLAYKTFGKLSAAKDNAIVSPCAPGLTGQVAGCAKH